MNTITITGRMGKDPELKTTAAGKDYAKFSVGVNRQFKKDVTDWFHVVTWGSTATYVANYLGKGRLVCVSGRLEIDEKDGKTYVNLVADQVEGLDRPRDDAPKASRSSVNAPTGQDEEDPFAED